MRRHLSSLLATWAFAQLTRARQPGFSIHHDLLAYPQFEIVFSDEYISESDAQALLDNADTAHTYDAGLSSQPDFTSNYRAAGDHEEEADLGNAAHSRPSEESYEIMSMPPYRYLCAIPVIEPPTAPNKTATELAKAEEARELARASAHGWDLINELEGVCLHYMSGWWSYRFCYGHEVVQFHAIAASVKSGPPKRDLTTAEYVLGRVTDGSRRREQNTRQNQGSSPPNTDLQIKGDQRYLVQRLGDGTICDLTGRERTIEIQYHCSPGSTQDRIGSIKEVTTCSYLMQVNTPRLCVDVAFQPPKEEKANTIACSQIVPASEQSAWRAQKTLEREALKTEAEAFLAGYTKLAAKAPINIGGIVVGGRQLIGQGEDGKEAPRLSPPRGYRGDSTAGLGKLIEIIASASGGGELQILTEEQIQGLNLSPEVIENLRQEIQALAGDRGWKLELVEAADNARELVGIIDAEVDEDGEEKEGRGQEEWIGAEYEEGGYQDEDEEEGFREEL